LYGDDNDVAPPKTLTTRTWNLKTVMITFESGNDDDSKDDDDEEEEETVDAKRLRLAREYLDKMEATRASRGECRR
jgi:hypothetical protein